MKKFALLSFAVVLTLFSGCVSLSRNDKDVLAQHHVSPSLYDRMSHQDPLALSDIIELSRCHLSSDFIIHYLDVSQKACHLSSGEVEILKKSGVSEEVIDYMLKSGRPFAPQPPAYYGYPYYGPYPYYPYGYYGGPVVILGGGGYGHRWH